MSVSQSHPREIVIGIDFGTTFSGLAIAETRRPDLITVIETWPPNKDSQEGYGSAKVPTQLRYTENGLEWGYQIPTSIPASERRKWFKLGFSEITESNSVPASPDQDPEKLTEEYLICLATHLEYMLERKLGKSIVDSVPIRCILTVPAIWTEKDWERTINAAKKAGFPSTISMQLVSEPEAAAIAAIDCLDSHNMKIGDTFVLCDAGGGTVDLISYTITALEPMLQIEEAAPGTGGLCGATFIDKNFEEFVIAKLGKQLGFDAETLGDAVEHFCSVAKVQYMPVTEAHTSMDRYSIPVFGLKDNSELNIRKGKWHVKSSQLKNIIEPVVEEVIALVKGQIEATRKPVQNIILVGGFGQNRFLAHAIQQAVGKEVVVKQPVHAWTAVVRGAVMMGLAQSNSQLATMCVTSRVARKHYGMQLDVKFIKSEHSVKAKKWCAKRREWRCDAMKWFIKKGDPLREDQPITISFCIDFDCEEGRPKKASITVYRDGSSNVAPVHQTAHTVPLCTLDADLRDIPGHVMDTTKTMMPDGKLYYRLRGQVEATYHSASTTYILSFRGKKYDTVTADYA